MFWVCLQQVITSDSYGLVFCACVLWELPSTLSCISAETCKLLVKIKTLWSSCVCMWTWLTTLVHVSAQKWQWTDSVEPCKSSNGGKSPIAINKLDHTIVHELRVPCTSPSPHSWSLASGNVMQNLFPDIYTWRALMSCILCRNYQVFRCLFIKPI